jgi:cyd operon protein YbgT
LHGVAFFFMIAAKGPRRSRFALRIYPRFERAALGRHADCAVRVAGLASKETAMWYFTWILGVGVALGFGIINVLWLETNGKFSRDPQPAATPSTAAGDKPS